MSFNINNSGKLLKYYHEKPETDIVIPDDVKIIGVGAFARCTNLKSVIIPESVVEIESQAFWGCTNLPYIDIPNSVEKIGFEAFLHCYALERVTLPSTLVVLGGGSFRQCLQLKEIVIPDKITSIPQWAFYECKRLAHVTLPKILTEIAEDAFYNCQSLKTIVIPESVTVIGENTFKESGLSRVVIPRSIKAIGGSAFLHTDNLVTNLSISDWQDSWGISKVRYALNFMNSYTAGDPFFDDVKEENNRSIKEYLYDIALEITPKNIKALGYLIKEELLEVEDIEYFSEKMISDAEIVAVLLDYKNTHFSAEYMEKWERDKLDKALGIKEYTHSDWNRIFKLVKYDGEYAIIKYRGSDDTVVVPGKIEGVPVTAIQPLTFEGLDNIKSVFIGEGVMRIDPEAFCDCSLTEITLPDTLRSIGVDAFSGCERLTEIKIPGDVTNIGEDAFRNCRSLVSVTLPDKITAVKAYTFFDTAISEIFIPEGILTIDEYAFSSCPALCDVTFPRSLQRIERKAFQDCCKINKIVLYKGINYIDETAFEDIEDLVIAAPIGSYAMDFAFEMGYRFEPLEPDKKGT